MSGLSNAHSWDLEAISANKKGSQVIHSGSGSKDSSNIQYAGAAWPWCLHGSSALQPSSNVHVGQLLWHWSWLRTGCLAPLCACSFSQFDSTAFHKDCVIFPVFLFSLTCSQLETMNDAPSLYSWYATVCFFLVAQIEIFHLKGSHVRSSCFAGEWSTTQHNLILPLWNGISSWFLFFFLVGAEEEPQPVNWSSNRSDRIAKKERGGLDPETSFIKLFINFSSVHKIKSQISWDHFRDASLILWGGS